ncbi:MAG: phosphatidate cytidylyltransferase [Acidobacteria bacterium]|nr:MAG: phosphatidate cytidylyltransferase [Acidobacteriota bacterium]
MQRVLTAVVAIPIVLLITIYAPDWIFAFVVGLVAGVAVEEYLSLGAVSGIGRPGKWFLAPAVLVTTSFIGGADWVLSTLALSAIALLTAAIFDHPIEAVLGRVAVGLSGVLYCCVPLGFLVLLPRELTLLLFAIIWAGDSAAYYGGRALGRHQLAPRISPKKTIEGSVAGLLASVTVGTACGVLFLGEPWLNLIVISAVTAVVGQLGDLAESVLKRSAGVKDSSSILPGHGGILDRLDSLFFAAPVFYWFFKA